MEKLLTVVVPVYKVEKYINKCLDSLILPNEQMDLLEVIVVNDGTPDNSAIMAKEYEKRFPETFKVIDKENGGHGSAWNKGVELASGKYLRFLDSDDWLTNLTEFMDKLNGLFVDMVFTDWSVKNEKTDNVEVRRYRNINPNIIYDTDSFDWTLTNKTFRGYNITNFHMCTYSTSLLKSHHPIFIEKCYYDDEILYVLPIIFAKTFCYFNVTLYNYLVGREGQTMDPKVQDRNYQFKLNVRQYLVRYVVENPVQSETKNIKLTYILNEILNDLFKNIMNFDYFEGKNKGKELEFWIHQNYANFFPNKFYYLYNYFYPFSWILYHKIKPIYRIIKSLVAKILGKV